jgi:hypothetical protein
MSIKANNQSSLINNHLKGKPNQTQYKANSNPITERPKMNIKNAIKMNYKDFIPMASKKQTRFKPKQSQFLYHWLTLLFIIAAEY